MSDQPDEILTIDEVATYLRAGQRTGYPLAANDQLPVSKLGGIWRFRRGELDRWVSSRTGKVADKGHDGAQE